MQNNLDSSITEAIEKQIEKGVIEKVLEEKFKQCIEDSLDDLFRWNGVVKKTIDEKLKSVLVPYLDSYDYSKYIVKVDEVLTNLIDELSLDNRKILQNFKSLCITDPPKRIKVSEIFSKWMDYVSKNINTYNLKISYDEGIRYQNVQVEYSFEMYEDVKWIKKKEGRILFSCEEDPDINFCIKIYNYDNDDHWHIDMNDELKISSLKYENEFKLFLYQLSQRYSEIELDLKYDSCEVEIEAEPEPTFE